VPVKILLTRLADVPVRHVAIAAVFHDVVAAVEAVRKLTLEVCIAREFYTVVVVSFPVKNLDKTLT
jgi:HD superfamily phosphodiesterase